MRRVGVGTGLRELPIQYYAGFAIDVVIVSARLQGIVVAWSVVAREDCLWHSLRYDRRGGVFGQLGVGQPQQ